MWLAFLGLNIIFLAGQTGRLLLAAHNGGPERRTRPSSINHQLDRVDVRRVVRGKEKHSFGQFFRFAPTAQSNRGGDEVSELSRLLGGIVGPGPALPDGRLGCSG